jgi:hypothetical protein
VKARITVAASPSLRFEAMGLRRYYDPSRPS